MRSRLQPVVLAGREVQTLRSEDLLSLLCAHGTKHHWTCLKWICDIAHLIRRHPEMNWTIVREEAHQLASRRMLFLGLLLTKKLLQAPVPQEIWQWIQSDAAVESLGAQVTENLFRPPDRKISGFASAFFHLKARERLRDGIRYSLSIAIAPTVADWQFMALSPRLNFLYYLLRPIRLAANYGQKLLSHFYVGNLLERRRVSAR